MKAWRNDDSDSHDFTVNNKNFKCIFITKDSMEDDPRSCHQITVVAQDSIEAIMEDPQSAFNVNKTNKSLYHRTLFSIIHEHPKLREVILC